MGYLTESLEEIYEKGPVIIPRLQVGKLRHGEGKRPTPKISVESGRAGGPCDSSVKGEDPTCPDFWADHTEFLRSSGAHG